jgi:hypothetical protein
LVGFDVAEGSPQRAILLGNLIGRPSHVPLTDPVDKSVDKMLKIWRSAHIWDALRPFAEIAETQPEWLARHYTDAGLIEKAFAS